MIADNLLSQVDKEGHRRVIIDEIIDNFNNIEALIHDNALYSTKNGNKCRKRNTKVWEIFLQWKDGSSH